MYRVIVRCGLNPESVDVQQYDAWIDALEGYVDEIRDSMEDACGEYEVVLCGLTGVVSSTFVSNGQVVCYK